MIPSSQNSSAFIDELAMVIESRANEKVETSTSYTSLLLKEGLARCAQKVGEEATEVVIASMKPNKSELIEESADLIYHLLVLLQISDVKIEDVIKCLQSRHSRKIDEE